MTVRVETYYTNDAIKFMEHSTGLTNVVMADNKEELIKEIEWNIMEQLEVGEFFGAVLMPDKVGSYKEVYDLDGRLLKVKANGIWHKTIPITEETNED
jgi:hypothetical protein